MKEIVDRYVGMGLQLKDSVSGDLNKDSLPDLILVFSQGNPPAEQAADTLALRPLLILTGEGSGLFRPASVNWNAVLCGTCGNRLGDPYVRTVIKGGFFSLEHASADKTLKWERIMTFKYSDSLKTWLLNRDGMISKDICLEGDGCGKRGEYHVIRTRKDFGHIPIDSFNTYALDDRYPDIDSGKVFPLPEGSVHSYMGWHRVKGGIWNILDYCTDRVGEGYLFFAKENGDTHESDSEGDLSVLYHLVRNTATDDSCSGFAFRGIPSVKPGRIGKARYDSAAGLYQLGRDTIRFVSEKLPSDPNWNLFVFKRAQDTLILSQTFGDGVGSSIAYAGDINGDGYLDFIEEYTSNSQTSSLFLSKTDSSGLVRMEVAGSITFTE